MALVRIVAPDTEPLTLQEVKDHLRVTLDDAGQDALITRLLAAARGYAEQFTRRAFLTQQWRLTLDDFPRCPDRTGRAGVIRIPRPPLQTVDRVQYVDLDGVTQTLDVSAAGVASVDSAALPPVIYLNYLQVWPSTRAVRNAVTVEFTAGYANAASVPAEITAAILLLCGHWFTHREDVVTGAISTPVHRAVDDLLWPYRYLEAA